MSNAVDLITLADARAQIGATGGDHDTTIAAYVTACSQLIDAYCGPVVNRTLTAEVYASADPLRLRYWPVSSVTTVVEYDTAGAATTLTADTVTTKNTNGFWLVPRSNVIERRASGARYEFPTGGTVAVTYVAGRAASTSAVSELFKAACRMQFAHLWRFERGTGSNTFGDGALPGFALLNAVKELLRAEALPPGIA